MADPTHQPAQPPADTPPPGQGATILPRAEEAPPAGAEQIAAEAQEKLTKMSGFWNRVNPEKEGEAKPGDKPAKPAEEKPAKPAAKPKGEPKPEDQTPDPEKKPAKRQKKEQELDPIKLAEATGREIGREMAKAQAAKDTPPAKPPEAPPELPEEFRRDAAVFEEMARLDPKKYGGIRQTLSKYTAEENKYIAKWEEENPGETFDGDDPVHNDFYKKVRPEFDEKDFEQAKESLIEERAAKRAEERFRQRESESEQRRERAAKIQPEVNNEMFGLIAEMVNETAPEHAELAKDWASIQKLDEENPLLADTIVEAHNQTKPLIEATMRLFRNIDQYDDRNPLHQQIGQLVAEAEAAVLKMPVNDRYDDHGRLFATQADYAKMSQAERAGHWYIAENELSALVRGRAIGQVKTIYQREKKKLERYTKGSAGASAPKNGTSAPKPKPEDNRNSDTRRPDTSSPSISGRSTLPGDGQGGAKPPANGRDLFFNRIIGA